MPLSLPAPTYKPCHVSDNFHEALTASIHESLCSFGGKTIDHSDGHSYCIFHLPSPSKDASLFNSALGAVLTEIDSKVRKAKRSTSWNPENSGIIYDFRFVYFPAVKLFSRRQFLSTVDFSSAVFSGRAGFEHSHFLGKALFLGTQFLRVADFFQSQFQNVVDFDKASFCTVSFRQSSFFDFASFASIGVNGECHFKDAQFLGFTDFTCASFSQRASFKGANFEGSDFSHAKFFGGADFEKSTFSSDANSFELTTFSGATSFRNATFKYEANFMSCAFENETDFSFVSFCEAVNFSSSNFLYVSIFYQAEFCGDSFFDGVIVLKDLIFDQVVFKGVVEFDGANFAESSRVVFRDTNYARSLSFRHASIHGYLSIDRGLTDESPDNDLHVKGSEPLLCFQNVSTNSPERVSFSRVSLHPSWFVNTDARCFHFVDVSWQNHRAIQLDLNEEIEYLRELGFKDPHSFRILTISLRNLAVNSEEFNRFEEGSRFRRSAFECERLERICTRHAKMRELTDSLIKPFTFTQFLSNFGTHIKSLAAVTRSFPFDIVHSLYRLLSGYGESWLRAFVWIVICWLFFSIAYWLFGQFGTNERPEVLDIRRSFSYSLFVMTLQKPDPRPLTIITQLLYVAETVAAPVQATLLALAIRRKFMR